MALYCSTEFACGQAVLLYIPWQRPELLAYLEYTIVLPVALSILALLIYPQLVLNRIAQDYKAAELARIEAGVIDELSSLSTEQLKGRLELHDVVSRSPGVVLDLGTLSRYFSAIVLPVLVLVEERFKLGRALLRLFSTWV